MPTSTPNHHPRTPPQQSAHVGPAQTQPCVSTSTYTVHPPSPASPTSRHQRNAHVRIPSPPPKSARHVGEVGPNARQQDRHSPDGRTHQAHASITRQQDRGQADNRTGQADTRRREVPSPMESGWNANRLSLWIWKQSTNYQQIHTYLSPTNQPSRGDLAADGGTPGHQP